MQLLLECWRKLRRLIRGSEIDRELAEEMRLHLEQRAEDLREAGLAPDAARRAARVGFGNPASLAAESRDAWSFVRLETWVQDAGYGARLLWRDRGWALTTTATLGLGIGGAVAIFTFINVFLVRPLPFPAPERLVHVWGADARSPDGRERVSVPAFLDLRRQATAFEDLAAFNYTEEELGGGTEPERVFAGRVTANAFSLLGVDPHIGRGFAPGADAPGAAREIVLSEAFWRTRFDADPGVLGRVLILDGEPHTVVGIMPPAFVFPLPITQVWAPRVLDPRTGGRERRNLQVFGRLRAGVTPEQASSDLDAVAARLREAGPAVDPHLALRAVPLREALNFASDILPAMAAALAASALFVLLIVCANVASLMLSRGVARAREMAVRAALGAGRPRLVRQLVTESTLLALLGGLAGVLLASWALALLAAQIPPDIYRVGDLAIDRAALAFALLASLLSVGFFGILPALRSTRGVLDASLAGAVAGAGRIARGHRLHCLLVVGQVAASTALLVAATLMMTSVRELRNVPLGFQPRGVTTAKLILPSHRYGGPEEVASFHGRLVERAAAIPGVSAAATVDYLPLNHEHPSVEVRRPGVVRGADDLVRAGRLTASPDYFRVMGIPIVEGRAFTDADSSSAPRRAVISRALAEGLGGGSPVGRELVSPRRGGPDASFTIVGVAADSRHDGLKDGTPRLVYFPQAQQPDRYFRLIVRTPEGAGTQAAVIRAAVHALDPQLPVTEIRTLSSVADEFLAPEVSIAGVLSVQSLLALFLALIGVYGVLAFSVAVRTREIGVRMALGSTRAAIVRLIGRQAVMLGTPGVAIGLGAAYGLARTLSGFAYGVRPDSPFVFLLAAAVLLACLLAASILPARRAAAVDPATALRVE